MLKLLLLVIGLYVAYVILKAYRRKVERRADEPAAKDEDMVRCAQCGVHLPRSESLIVGNASY